MLSTPESGDGICVLHLELFNLWLPPRISHWLAWKLPFLSLIHGGSHLSQLCFKVDDAPCVGLKLSLELSLDLNFHSLSTILHLLQNFIFKGECSW